MEAHSSYNVSAWKPKVSKHVPTEWGILTVRQGSVEGARGGDARNVWDIRLNEVVNTALVVEVGAGESDLDLDTSIWGYLDSRGGGYLDSRGGISQFRWVRAIPRWISQATTRRRRTSTLAYRAGSGRRRCCCQAGWGLR